MIFLVFGVWSANVQYVKEKVWRTEKLKIYGLLDDFSGVYNWRETQSGGIIDAFTGGFETWLQGFKYWLVGQIAIK